VVDQVLRYGELRIPYKVYFRQGKGRKLAIHVHPDGVVQVDAPPATPLGEIKAAISKRARWLCGHIARIQTQGAVVLPREYVSGESHYYLGRRYILKIRAAKYDKPSVKLRCGQIQVVTDNGHRDHIQSMLWEWYRTHAQVVFQRRLGALCDGLNWIHQAPHWKLLAMKRQWGSCSPTGVLSLNPHLVKAPTQCIDYVLLHELCHTRVHNHSRRFYRLLSTHMPGWEAVKGRLDGMAELLLNT
jgi:predicted metal-dependent hydrolase